MSAIGRELRLAFRRMASAPGATAVTLVTLALAIGANTALFSIFHALVLRPLPIANPETLVTLRAIDGRTRQNRPIYFTAYSQLARLRAFDDLELYSGGGLFQIEWRGTRSEGLIEASTPGLFEALGLRPHIGRFFTEEDAPGEGPAAAVTVLSYDFWQRAFGGDPDVVGESVLIAGTPATVIGIAPRGYRGFYVDSGFGFSVPLTFLNRQMSTGPARPLRGLNVVGRLAPAVPLAQARAAVDAAWPAIRASSAPVGLSEREQQELPTHDIRVSSLAEGFSSLRNTYGEPLRILWLATGVLLAIGCLNLSALFLARTTSREAQLAIQRALGASKQAIARQLLVESTLPALIGATLALPLAWGGARIAESMIWQGDGPLSQRMTPDARVLIVTGAIAVVTGILVGLVPAWRLAGTRAGFGLGPERTVTRAANPWIKALLALQAALALVLLVIAALLASTLHQLRNVDSGLRADGIRWSRLFAVPNGYRDQDDAAYYPELVRALSEAAAQPVALATYFPSSYGLEHLLPMRPLARGDAAAEYAALDALVENVTPGFFEILGVPLLLGRDFTWTDAAQHPPVVIVNQSVRRLLFGNENPVGQRLRIGPAPGLLAEIVGVVGDASIGSYKRPDMPVAFRPRMQELARARAPVLIFRGGRDPSAADAAIEQAIARLGHEYPRRFMSLDAQIEASLLKERVLARLSSLFAGLAAVMTLVGVYATLSYAVRRRTREIGVRMALGAHRTTVLRGIMWEGLGVMVAGIALGVPAALATVGMVRSWLFGIAPWDPTILALASACFVGVGAVAALVPALRASSIDPARALREG